MVESEQEEVKFPLLETYTDVEHSEPPFYRMPLNGDFMYIVPVTQEEGIDPVWGVGYQGVPLGQYQNYDILNVAQQGLWALMDHLQTVYAKLMDLAEATEAAIEEYDLFSRTCVVPNEELNALSDALFEPYRVTKLPDGSYEHKVTEAAEEAAAKLPDSIKEAGCEETES